jgi:hypothetical protein
MRFMFFSGGFGTCLVLVAWLGFIEEQPVQIVINPATIQPMPPIRDILAALDVPMPKDKKDKIGELIGGLK